jgi:hypothetical protein
MGERFFKIKKKMERWDNVENMCNFAFVKIARAWRSNGR